MCTGNWGDTLRKLLGSAIFAIGLLVILRQASVVIPQLLAEGTVGAGLVGLSIYYLIVTLFLGAISFGIGWAPTVITHPDPTRVWPPHDARSIK